MIRFKNIVKSYKVGNEKFDVLNNINIEINEGEFVAIMGPSGSGKSTVMNIIGCLDRPSNGSYIFDDKEISTYTDVQLAKIRNKHIGFVFQQFQLLPRLNALKNVELPMIYAGINKKEREEKAKSALIKVGLKDRMYHLPNELSGGQKQRIAIARSIVNNPKLILADEPTGSLDTKTSFSIMEQFKLLNKSGTTIVIVTHEQEIANYAYRTIMIRDGEVFSPSNKGRADL